MLKSHDFVACVLHVYFSKGGDIVYVRVSEAGLSGCLTTSPTAIRLQHALQLDTYLAESV